jgi:hypothetical protein
MTAEDPVPLYWHVFTEDQINTIASLLNFRDVGDGGQRGFAERELDARFAAHGCRLADLDRAATERRKAKQIGVAPVRASGSASAECPGCQRSKALPGPHDMRLLPGNGVTASQLDPDRLP